MQLLSWLQTEDECTGEPFSNSQELEQPILPSRLNLFAVEVV
jgi:hypothetical protein